MYVWSLSAIQKYGKNIKTLFIEFLVVIVMSYELSIPDNFVLQHHILLLVLWASSLQVK